MIKRPRIYVAGPYSKPDPCINTRDAVMVADELWRLGFTPFVPHLTHFWHTMSPKSYDSWLDYDNQWIPCCHGLYRMPGESSGADKEVELARSLGIPVSFSIEDLVRFWKVAA